MLNQRHEMVIHFANEMNSVYKLKNSTDCGNSGNIMI